MKKLIGDETDDLGEVRVNLVDGCTYYTGATPEVALFWSEGILYFYSPLFKMSFPAHAVLSTYTDILA